ncbi:MAG: copper-binding protein [Rhodomicrobium sp.]|nr:copper-binding protein [Rhodomicrobium sp.]
MAVAEGNLATKCEELPTLTFGVDATGYKVSQETYEIVTGKCYELEIASTGNKEYALRGAEFFRNIWLRKIEAGGMEIKVHSLYELEFENQASAEIFFVPIVPGSYTLAAEGLEGKGTLATFKVK